MNTKIKKVITEELATLIQTWANGKEILVAMRLKDNDFKMAAAAAIEEIETQVAIRKAKQE